MSPFVCGILHPRIYMPVSLSGDERSYVLCHEQMHIRRNDERIKFFAYLVLCAHWFNPFAWLSFALMSKDMELSCDERVLRENCFDRKAYSLALLRFAFPKWPFALSPLAFGENNVKNRIKNILSYKKPALWLVVAVIVICIFAAIICLSNPSAALGENSSAQQTYEKPAAHASNPAEAPEGNEYAEELYENRTAYIGDDSRLLETLRYPEGIYMESFQLNTTQKPYQITVHYGYLSDMPPQNASLESDYFINSALLLALVDNTDTVRHIGHWSDSSLSSVYFDYTHTRESVEEYLGVDVRIYAQSPGKLAELIRLLQNKTGPYVAQRTAPNEAGLPVGQAAWAKMYAMGCTTFEDLDGDGKEEEIYYGRDDLKVNGVSFKGALARNVDLNVPSRDVFLIADIDAADARKELALRADGPSIDPETYFYTYAQGKLQFLGSVPFHTDDLSASFDGRGNVKGTLPLSVLQTWSAPAEWRLKGQSLSLVEQPVYYSSSPLILKNALPIYAKIGDKEPYATLPPQAVTLTATDNKGWCAVEGADKTKGWFKIKDYDYLTDLNKCASDVFDNLNTAG